MIYSVVVYKLSFEGEMQVLAVSNNLSLVEAQALESTYLMGKSISAYINGYIRAEWV